MNSKKDVLIRPKEFLCPFCGRHHIWDEKSLKHSEDITIYENFCPYVKSLYSKGISFAYGKFYCFFVNQKFFYCIENWCNNMISSSIGGCIPIKTFQVDQKSNMILHTIPITTKESLGTKACRKYCSFNEYCSLLKNVDMVNTNSTTVKFGFKFSDEEFAKLLKLYK